MASTKVVTVLHNNVTLTAGAGNTTSSSVNLDDGYGAQLHVKLTNGATAPTVPAQTQVQVSPDDSNWYDFGGPLKGGTANSGVYSWSLDIPMGVEYVRCVSGSNTGQNVTARAELSEVTAV
jgi:hypothetical protein